MGFQVLETILHKKKYYCRHVAILPLEMYIYGTILGHMLSLQHS